MEHEVLMKRISKVQDCMRGLACQTQVIEEAATSGNIEESAGMIEIDIRCKTLGRGKQKICLPAGIVLNEHEAQFNADNIVRTMCRGICSLCSVYNGLWKG